MNKCIPKRVPLDPKKRPPGSQKASSLDPKMRPPDPKMRPPDPKMHFGIRGTGEHFLVTLGNLTCFARTVDTNLDPARARHARPLPIQA